LRGTVEVAGAELVLRPDEGTEALHDPDVPSADFDRPIKNLAPERYSWALAGSGAERQLTLTDAQGRTIRYAPE
jgi:hypothetical protein